MLYIPFAKDAEQNYAEPAILQQKPGGFNGSFCKDQQWKPVLMVIVLNLIWTASTRRRIVEQSRRNETIGGSQFQIMHGVYPWPEIKLSWTHAASPVCG